MYQNVLQELDHNCLLDFDPIQAFMIDYLFTWKLICCPQVSINAVYGAFPIPLSSKAACDVIRLVFLLTR